MRKAVTATTVVVALAGAATIFQYWETAEGEAAPPAGIAHAAPVKQPEQSRAEQPGEAEPRSAGFQASRSPRFGTAGCDACLKEKCDPYVGAVPLLENCKDATCEAAFACFQRNHCASDTVTVPQCYCGPVTLEVCLADGFDPYGPCEDLVERGLGLTDPREVIGAFFDGRSPTSAGISLFNCAAELCVPECLNDSAIPRP